jgi:DNA-binding response OmpR family regulator
MPRSFALEAGGSPLQKLLFSLRISQGLFPMSVGRVYQFGPFRLDAGGRMLFREGQRLALSPKGVELLIALVEAQANTVGKDELLNKVWADTVVEEGSLTTHISILRKTSVTSTSRPFRSAGTASRVR